MVVNGLLGQDKPKARRPLSPEKRRRPRSADTVFPSTRPGRIAAVLGVELGRSSSPRQPMSRVLPTCRQCIPHTAKFQRAIRNFFFGQRTPTGLLAGPIGRRLRSAAITLWLKADRAGAAIQRPRDSLRTRAVLPQRRQVVTSLRPYGTRSKGTSRSRFSVVRCWEREGTPFPRGFFVQTQPLECRNDVVTCSTCSLFPLR